jgi:DNA-binding transcriptional ArsR family regulator
MVGVLAEAALKFRGRNATYRKTADISENLASRDLKALTDQGLLIAKGERRGRYYIGSDELLAFGVDAVGGEAQRIPDPFDPEASFLPGFGPP